MSFFNQSNSPYKPQIRQEGFSPTLATNTNAHPSPPDTNNHSPLPSPQGAFNDLFSMPAHTFLADSTSNGTGSGNSSTSHQQHHHNPRKYPSSSSSSDPATMDFGDELASLMGDRSPTAGPHGQGHSQQGSSQQYEERYGPGSTHNIFDISAPTSINTSNSNNNNPNGAHPSSVSSTTSTTGFGAGTTNGAGSTPSSLHSEYHPHHHAPPGFNSTLPALNSSMRYEPHAGSPINPPPSAFHNFNVPGGAGAGVNRHTPSPIHSHSMHSPILGGTSASMGHHHSHSHGGHVSRSRSRSRPPTGGATSSSSTSNANGNNSAGNNASGIGPARTTRARRNNSVSGTSPPPFGHHGHHGRPHAIVIPGSARGQSGNGQGQGWFGAVSGQSSASEYSLPTPADTHPLSHSLSHSHHQYNPFSLSDNNGNSSGNNGGMHPSLPPVSSLHSPLHMPYHNTSSNNSNSMSVPGGGGIGIPKSPLEFSLNGGMPKSPSLMDYGLSNFGGNAGAYGMTPPSSVPSMGNMGMGVGMNNMNIGMGMAQSPVLSSSMGVGVSSLSNGLGGRGVGMLASSPPGGSVLSSSLPSAGLNSSSSTIAGSAPTSGSGVGAASGSNAAGIPTQDKQSLLANEKRRRRRESHNAVERRRRDNINEKISELATLIPECMLDGSGTGSGTGGSPSALAASPGLVDPADPLLPSSTSEKKDSIKEEGGQDEGGVVKANKGMILRKSVDYIRYLQQLVTAQGARNRELEQELKAYRGGSSGAPSETGDSTSSNLKKDLSSPSPSIDKELSHLGNGDDHDQEMMLHDGSSMDFGIMGGYGSGAGGMLPSMPEGDDEDDPGDESAHHGAEEGEEGMDVDGGKGEERGRTRGVRSRAGAANGSANGNGFHHPPLGLKEEIPDEDVSTLGGFGGLTMVGMQA